MVALSFTRNKMKKLWLYIGLSAAVVLIAALLVIFATAKAPAPICGDGICQENEVQGNFCELDCSQECTAPTGGDIEEDCSLGWGATYLMLSDEGLISVSDLVETDVIDYSNPEILRIANLVRRDNIKDTIKATARWTYENIRYEENNGYSDCRNVKASEIIQRGFGVCSTMSKVNIALLRANGIPAYSKTGCLNFNDECTLKQTFFPKLFPKFIDIRVDEQGYAATYGYLHNWVIVPLYDGSTIEDVLVESTSGQVFEDPCVNYKTYYSNPGDSLACGLNVLDPNVQDCRDWGG